MIVLFKNTESDVKMVWVIFNTRSDNKDVDVKDIKRILSDSGLKNVIVWELGGDYSIQLIHSEWRCLPID
jgi:hypothetical protein